MEYKPSNGVKVAHPVSNGEETRVRSPIFVLFIFFQEVTKMIDQNTIANQTKLREEVSEIKKYLSLIEREINSSDHVAQLSDWQFQDIWKRLKVIHNFTFNANHFWAKYTDNKELKKKVIMYKFVEEAKK